MNILFVSAIFPYPLHSGGQVRIYNLLKRLSKEHEITLYSFIRDSKEKEYIGELSFCKKVVTARRGRAWQAKYILKSLFSSYSFLYTTYYNENMRELLRKELQSPYDRIHIEPGYVWPSLPQTDIPIVVSEHNIEHEVYRRYVQHSNIFLRPFMYWDVVKMQRWERRIWDRAASVTAASYEDCGFLKSQGVHSTLVSNGVDTNYFSFHPKKIISSLSPIFLYVGTFRWIQNRDAVSYILRDLWPAIQKKYPKATFRIVGGRDLHLPGVISIESVPDIREEYWKADMLLAPIRVGGGTKYKILESMASGLPVVTTPLGAQGMDMHHNKEAWIAQSTPEILGVIEDIISGSNRPNVLKNARKLVVEHYSWEYIAKKLDEVWKKQQIFR